MEMGVTILVEFTPVMVFEEIMMELSSEGFLSHDQQFCEVEKKNSTIQRTPSLLDSFT